MKNIQGISFVITTIVTILGGDPFIAQGRSIYVSLSGNGQDGLSWETAYQSIQAAIDGSQINDDLYISDDSYDERVLVTKTVTIHGGLIYGTTGEALSSRQTGSRYSKLIYSEYPLTAFVCQASCKVSGFRITPQKTSCFTVYRCHVIIDDCIIEHGVTGVYVNEGSADLHQVVVDGNNLSGSGGGFVIIEGSSVSMDSCSITNNVSYNGSGGGISCSLSTLIMENCIVSNNSAYTNSPEVTVSKGGGVVIGGGGSFGIFRNCLIANNWSTKWRQLVIGTSTETNVSLDNCTIIGDLAADAHWRNAPPTMTNCIIWGSNGILAGEEGEADISYSCIQGGYTGEGNISEDPLFRDPTHGNYRLLPESPCIDTGDTSGPSDDLNGNPRPVDIAGIGREVTDTYDMGAYEVQLNEVPTPTPTPTVSQVDPGNTMLYK